MFGMDLEARRGCEVRLNRGWGDAYPRLGSMDMAVAMQTIYTKKTRRKARGVGGGEAWRGALALR
jgi:hypothetical protein